MRPYSVPEAVAWEIPAKGLNVEGIGTLDTLTMTNRRMYWTRRQSLPSKTPATPCAEVHWPEIAAIVEHRIEKHSLSIAQRRGVAERLRFWVSGSDGDRMRRLLTGLGFDTHAWT
jgi:thioesterase domain-containing protein